METGAYVSTYSQTLWSISPYENIPGCPSPSIDEVNAGISTTKSNGNYAGITNSDCTQLQNIPQSAFSGDVNTTNSNADRSFAGTSLGFSDTILDAASTARLTNNDSPTVSLPITSNTSGYYLQGKSTITDHTNTLVSCSLPNIKSSDDLVLVSEPHLDSQHQRAALNSSSTTLFTNCTANIVAKKPKMSYKVGKH